METKNNGATENFDEEYKELKNELVVPAFRKFCREYNLLFHFKDEFAEEAAYHAVIGLGELKLHWEAMKYFNLLKPELVEFKNNVVRYKFIDRDGTFSYDLMPIDEYLTESSDKSFYLGKLEARYKSLSEIIAIIFSCTIFIAAMLAIAKFSPWEFLQNFSYIPSLGLGIPLYYLIHKYFSNTPRKISDAGRFKSAPEQLEKLRKKLKKLQRSESGQLSK